MQHDNQLPLPIGVGLTKLQALRFVVALVSGAVVAGALYLIVTRSTLLAVDLGPQVSRFLWCF